MSDQESVRVLPREPGDQWEPFESDRFSRAIAAALRSRLGPDTLVASSVNGASGLWVGFSIAKDGYWLQADPTRLQPVTTGTWMLWVGIAILATLIGSAAVARLINQPLRDLSFAASRIGDGEYESRLDENTLTSEIRQVNMGFNRMARELAKVEEDRAVMLAGISHDLRTPLARLRLETEMSVEDEEAKRNMALDIDQLDAIIDKFMDYARPGDVKLMPVHLSGVVDREMAAFRDTSQIQITSRVAIDTKVLADDTELGRVLANLFENARRYGLSTDTGIAKVIVSYARTGPWVIVSVRDHGPGVAEEKLGHLTTPFFRGDAARTAATGAGLGLAIVDKALHRMGGSLELANADDGGLIARIRLKKAPVIRAARPCPAGEGSAVSRRARQQAHRARFDRFAAADRAHLLGGLGLDADLIDRDRERLRDALAHRRDVRREFRRLRDHGAVDVADLPARAAHAARGLCQQRDRIRACELGVGIREVVADVAERRRAEQRVGDRVAQRVGIRVAEQAVAVRDLDAAEDEATPGDQRVRVPAFADSPRRGLALSCVHARVSSSRRASSKSPPTVSLKFSSAPTTRHGAWPSCSIAAASSVTSPLACASACCNMRSRNICGVCAAHLPARSSVAPTRPSCSALSVSASGSASRPPTASSRQASISRSTHSGRIRQRAASCTSTQSSGRAPRTSSSSSPLATLRARVAPPQRAAQCRSSANDGTCDSNWSSSGASTTSVPAMRGPHRGPTACARPWRARRSAHTVSISLPRNARRRRHTARGRSSGACRWRS